MSEQKSSGCEGCNWSPFIMFWYFHNSGDFRQTGGSLGCSGVLQLSAQRRLSRSHFFSSVMFHLFLGAYIKYIKQCNLFCKLISCKACIYIYTNKYMNIKIYKYRYKDIFIYNTSYMPISFFVDAVFPTLLHLHLQRWPPFARGTSWLQWFQGCHGDDFQSWCGPGIGYQVQRGATVKPADSKRGSFFHPFAKTEKKTTALKSSGFWNLQDWFLLLSFIITVMLQNALNHIEPTVTDVSFDTSVLLSRLNPFSTLPCYGIEYWPKDAKLIQAHQISRDQFTLWLFSCRLEDCPTQLHRDYIKLL